MEPAFSEERGYPSLHQPRTTETAREGPSQLKRFFYTALGAQWNPERVVEWNGALGLKDSLREAMAHILSPIVLGEFSAFNGIPQRILSFKDYEVKQYLAAQLVDETRHAEAFDLYLERIGTANTYKKSWRNIHIVRYFNEMKRLTDDDQWLAGLLVTEITARVLLGSYVKKVNCPITEKLFSRILTDEARHISFVNYYMTILLKGSAASDRAYLAKVTELLLRLTRDMLDYYRMALQAFNLHPEILFLEIQKEILKSRAAREIMRDPEWIVPG